MIPAQRSLVKAVGLGLGGWLLTVAQAAAELPQSPGATYFVRDYTELTAQPASQPWWSMTADMVIKLGVVLGLLYLTMWVLRRYVLGSQARRTGTGRALGAIDILDSATLAPNRTVYLVEVADRVLVLGATTTALATLAEIREPEAIDLLKRGAGPTAMAPPSFAEHLRPLTDHLSGPPAPTFLHDKIGELRTLATHFRRSPVE